ncbi:MAG: hypothetical protein V4456_08370 [Bacteroidota bacterium]
MNFKFTFRSLFSIIWLVASACTTGYAQNNLARVVSVGNVDQQQIGAVLKKISGTGNFNFVYNNQTIPADSVVSVANYRGTIYNFLNNLLGADYEFKEVPGYIVLRHAPRKLNLTAEVNTDPGKQWVVKGHVTDAADNREMNHVSVYEKNLLISTLTDDQGNFELKLKSWNGAVVLTATKENYRDTSLFVLQDVHVTSKSSKKRYEYYPEGDQTGGRFSRGFARLFVSSKQMIQGLNLGSFFALSPYQISLTPGLSSHGMYSSQVIDHISLNLWGGYTAGVQGVELAGIFNINRTNVGFLQAAGLFNIVGGNTYGVQLAGLYNQVFNNASGFQAAGALNKTHTFSGGVQLAALGNITDHISGVQIAGLYNKTNTLNGMQFSGFINRTHSAKGLQLTTLLNSSKEKIGSQIAGVANIASKVNGVQIAGLFNMADSSDYPIALLNFIKNGKKTIAISTDEFLFTHVDFRSGGRVFYGLIGGGYKFTNEPLKYAVDAGFGVHVKNGTFFTMDAEYVYRATFGDKNKSYKGNSLKLLPGFKLNRTLQLFAGPSFNLTSFDKENSVNIPGWELSRHTGDPNITVMHVGITGGLQIVL